jgi:alkaline phosphatase D
VKAVGSITSMSFNYERFNRMLPDNPHIKWQDDRTRGYGLGEVTPQTMTVSLMNTATTWRRGVPFTPIKRYVVERGRPAIQEG